MNRSCGTVVPDGHGPDRQAMGRARADLPATAATGWPRPAVGGHPRRVERRALDPPDRGAVGRSAAALSAVPNLPIAASKSGSDRAASIASCNGSRRISATAVLRTLTFVHSVHTLEDMSSAYVSGRV